MDLKWCVLVYFDGEYERSLGVYNFQEPPRINEEIWIGHDEYTVIRVIHEFIKPQSPQEPAKEYKEIVYVKKSQHV